MPTDIVKDLVSVQPMSQPSGLVFYLDYKYGLIVITFDEELWWEENDKGEWICPQIQKDYSISDAEWRKQLDDHLIIPQWEIDYQENGWKNERTSSFGKVYLDDYWYTADGLRRI